MVKFGDRMIDMQHAGWEAHYINYEELKLQIDNIERCQTDKDLEAKSDEFLATLKQMLVGVDAFVADQMSTLQAKTDLTDAKSLHSAKSFLKVLCRYVGTNVIAATKIVKKHDKHVQPSLRKRVVVGNIIRGSKVFAELIAYSSTVQRGGVPSSKVTPSDSSVAPTEEEAEMRGLPDWLLSGATLNDAASETAQSEEEPPGWHYPSFFSTYLDDWRAVPAAEMAELVSRSNSEAGDGDDKYNVDFKDDKVVPWVQLSPAEKAKMVISILLRLCVIAGALYFFICSLSFLADGFRLVGGKGAAEVFQNSEVFNNPVAGMLVGVMVTVLVQSSSTSTSIFITMVAASLLTVKQAIPLVMGANVGTSVTSTIVALGQSGNPDEFRRAFAAATVHDMFNFMSVLVLLPLEAITSYLFTLSKALIDASPGLSGEKPPDILKKLTKPFTSKIISVNKKLINELAEASQTLDCAHVAPGSVDYAGESCYDEKQKESMLKHLFGDKDIDASDTLVGALVLLGALAILCISLFVIVYLLKSILKGNVAVWLHKSVNGQVPDIKIGENIRIPMGWLSGYLAMLVGMGLTICVQSSSITTSALTPLVGIGVLKVERMYPTVLGANIGTCITGVLAALAADPEKIALTLQVAYAHLFFNLSGIFIWYGIWPLRAVPIRLAKALGDTTAKYRWFALAYLAVCFFIVPAIFMGFSLAGDAPLLVLITLCIITAVFVGTVNVMQARFPERLPIKLRTWAWLPEPLRSLRPYDEHLFQPLGRVCICCKSNKSTTVELKNVKAELAPSNSELAIAAERM